MSMRTASGFSGDQWQISNHFFVEPGALTEETQLERISNWFRIFSMELLTLAQLDSLAHSQCHLFGSDSFRT